MNESMNERKKDLEFLLFYNDGAKVAGQNEIGKKNYWVSLSLNKPPKNQMIAI